MLTGLLLASKDFLCPLITIFSHECHPERHDRAVQPYIIITLLFSAIRAKQARSHTFCITPKFMLDHKEWQTPCWSALSWLALDQRSMNCVCLQQYKRPLTWS
jgi:hypothetical protein